MAEKKVLWQNIAAIDIATSHTKAKGKRETSLKLLKFLKDYGDASPYEMTIKGNELILTRNIGDIDYFIVIKDIHTVAKNGINSKTGLYSIGNNISDIVGRSKPNKCLVDILYYKDIEELEELYASAVKALDIPLFNSKEVDNFTMEKLNIKTDPGAISLVQAKNTNAEISYTEGIGLRKSPLKNCLFIDGQGSKLDVVSMIIATIIDSTGRVPEIDKFLFSLNLSPYTFRGHGFIRDAWTVSTSSKLSELDEIFSSVVENVYGVDFHQWYKDNYKDGDNVLSNKEAVFRGVSVIPYMEKAIDGKKLLPSFLFDNSSEKGDYTKSFNVAVEVAQRMDGKEQANSYFVASYLSNKFGINNFDAMSMRLEFTHSFVSFLMTLGVNPEDTPLENVSYKKASIGDNYQRYYKY